MYLGIQVDVFDAIFDCITNMIGRVFFICKLSSRRHVTKHAKDLMGRRELVALLNLSSWCLVTVEQLFLAVPRGCLQFVIVVFPDHTHLLFFNDLNSSNGWHYGTIFFKPEKNLEFFRLKICAIDAYPGKLD